MLFSSKFIKHLALCFIFALAVAEKSIWDLANEENLVGLAKKGKAAQSSG
jgi:hypothetical protein